MLVCRDARGEMSKMKIPKTLKIGGHIYKIIFPYEFKERYDRDADCDRDLNLIRISKTVGSDKRSESSIIVTFIHEVLHAIDFVSGHKIFIDNEKALEGISEGIYQVLVDNKLLPDVELES